MRQVVVFYGKAQTLSGTGNTVSTDVLKFFPCINSKMPREISGHSLFSLVYNTFGYLLAERLSLSYGLHLATILTKPCYRN